MIETPQGKTQEKSRLKAKSPANVPFKQQGASVAAIDLGRAMPPKSYGREKTSFSQFCPFLHSWPVIACTYPILGQITNPFI